jgi:hypothetical protein
MGFSVYGLFGSGAFGYRGFWVYGLFGSHPKVSTVYLCGNRVIKSKQKRAAAETLTHHDGNIMITIVGRLTRNSTCCW